MISNNDTYLAYRGPRDKKSVSAAWEAIPLPVRSMVQIDSWLLEEQAVRSPDVGSEFEKIIESLSVDALTPCSLH